MSSSSCTAGPRVRRRGQWTTFRYPHHPFNAVGWAGDLAPYRLSVSDIRPVTAPGYHLPPSPLRGV